MAEPGRIRPFLINKIMASLRRISDGAGDVGASVLAIRNNPDTGELETEQTDRPLVGWALRVGSVTARSYSNQDWWMTTPVTKIVEADISDEYCYYKFETGNSVYEFWSGNCPEEKFSWK